MAASPRTMRNFWVTAEVDGVSNPKTFGPKDREGGFKITVAMKAHEKGKTISKKVFTIYGIAHHDGAELEVTVLPESEDVRIEATCMSVRTRKGAD